MSKVGRRRFGGLRDRSSRIGGTVDVSVSRSVSNLALIATAATAWGAGCGAQDMHPVTVAKVLPSPVVSRNEEVLDAHLLDAIAGEEDGQAYRVGPGDTLLVAVYNHPELAIATYAGTMGGSASPSGRTTGLYIDNDGTLQFPLIGTVRVAGKTTEELRKFLEQELARYVKEPRVTVQVIFNGSIRYYLLGQFVAPGLKFADRPMRLLEALTLGDSIILDHASLAGAYVARSGRRLPVNFRRLLRDGDMRQNIRLHGGDTIFVPDNVSEQAFVFAGAAGSNAKGGAIPFVNGRLDLLQALAQSGIGFRERAQGLLSEVRVIRSEADRGQFFVIDVNKILRGDAGSFLLAPGDIVFVPETAITTWNEALEQILPTLQTVSGLLNPFVQIKFLSQ
jgi:polysaccharide biosynthesis/export protein